MTFLVDRANVIATGILYTSVKQHRENVNEDKSIWIISIEDEVSVFKRTLQKSWIEDSRKYGWGLHIINGSNTLRTLGENRYSGDLKIAKFVKDENDESWHGYPADYRQKRKDKPPEEVLLKWRDEGLIEKHHVSKIRSGRICNL